MGVHLLQGFASESICLYYRPWHEDNRRSLEAKPLEKLPKPHPLLWPRTYAQILSILWETRKLDSSSQLQQDSAWKQASWPDILESNSNCFQINCLSHSLFSADRCDIDNLRSSPLRCKMQILIIQY